MSPPPSINTICQTQIEGDSHACILHHTDHVSTPCCLENPKTIPIETPFAGTLCLSEYQIRVPEPSRNPHKLLSKHLHTQSCRSKHIGHKYNSEIQFLNLRAFILSNVFVRVFNEVRKVTILIDLPLLGHVNLDPSNLKILVF